MGTVLHLEGHFSSPSALGYRPDMWRAQRAEAPGGGLASMGLHIVDTMQWLFGPVGRVSCLARRAAAPVDIDDVATALFEFDLGLTATLSSLFATSLDAWLRVCTTNGIFAASEDFARLTHTAEWTARWRNWRWSLSIRSPRNSPDSRLLSKANGPVAVTPRGSDYQCRRDGSDDGLGRRERRVARGGALLNGRNNLRGPAVNSYPLFAEESQGRNPDGDAAIKSLDTRMGTLYEHTASSAGGGLRRPGPATRLRAERPVCKKTRFTEWSVYSGRQCSRAK